MPRLIPNRLVRRVRAGTGSVSVHRRRRQRQRLLRAAAGGRQRRQGARPKRRSPPAPSRSRSSPKATCFGKGSGGSGKPVSLVANTAMGLLAKASKSTGSLNPLLISDHFDFGLALCGIGGSVAKDEASWYLKINHKAQSVGGDQAKIHAGDEVLWALEKTSAPDFPYPNELALVAPGDGEGRQGVQGARLLLRRKGQARRRSPAPRSAVPPEPPTADGSADGHAEQAAPPRCHQERRNPLGARWRSASAASAPPVTR